jgi:hypothetical protein
MPAEGHVQDVVTCEAHVIRLDCPIDCLKSVLSAMSFNPLARAYDAPYDPPSTIGDVVELWHQRRLREIGGLGRRRIGEIEASLVFAGLPIQSNHSS